MRPKGSELHRRPDGSYTHPDDPGEPSNGHPRVSVTTQEARLLARFARGRHVVEIGTGLGISTRALASTAKTVTTVDIDPWVHQTIWPGLPPNVIRLTSRAPLRGQFGFGFIDGDHNPDPVLADLAYLRDLPTHLIAVHDSRGLQPILDKHGEWLYLDTTHGIGLQWAH